MNLILGDALSALPTLPDNHFQACITSPPYWGLRDYGLPPILWPAITFSPMPGLPPITIPEQSACLGLEPDPWAYTAHLVAIFREVRRTLRTDGTLWLNLGDSYATGGGAVGRCPGGGDQGDRFLRQGMINTQPNRMPIPNLKPKDLIGIPWRVAFALQADGWYLRQDIIWHKPNPMPESVTDRCTKAHEYLFLLSKSQRYYYNAQAIQEPVAPSQIDRVREDIIGGNKGALIHHSPGATYKKDRTPRGKWSTQAPQSSGKRIIDRVAEARANGAPHDSPLGTTRNRRSVWTIPTKPFTDAHFATFPPELPKLAILASSKPGHHILDPFFGAGTVGLVAQELGRKYVGIEPNAKYLELANSRCLNSTPGLNF